ncbi:Phenylacrylic acid decarboxylase [mine drainage metagenome]|uniref:Phenylacrylic acid decarboxylase n=1 Tax=mine drainage metagenome TaxID=410659 RepID=T1AC85_9ZZZZ
MDSSAPGPPVVVGITGASGSAVVVHLLEALAADGIPVALVATAAGRAVLREECGYSLDRFRRPGFVEYSDADPAAPIASGSRPTRGMAVVPCSANTVAKIAHGLADTLLTRAAHVHLKERRRLVLMPRETPLSPIMLRNLTSLAELGVAIVDPAPAFYLKPKSVDEITRYLAGKVLEQLGLPQRLYRGWKEERP